MPVGNLLKIAVLSGKQTSYADRVLAAFGASLIDYRKLIETAGTVVIDSSGKGHGNGAYSGVTLDSADGPGPTMGRGGLWDGVNDYADIYSAALNSDFSGAAGTLALWVKVSAAGVWTDSTTRYVARFAVNGSNLLYLRRQTSNNTLRTEYLAGGTSKTVDISISTTNWFHFALTWDKAADAMKAFIDGAQSGSTQTGLGTWSGSLLSAGCVYGALATTAANPFSGYIAHAVLLNRAATAAEIAALAVAA